MRHGSETRQLSRPRLGSSRTEVGLGWVPGGSSHTEPEEVQLELQQHVWNNGHSGCVLMYKNIDADSFDAHLMVNSAVYLERFRYSYDLGLFDARTHVCHRACWVPEPGPETRSIRPAGGSEGGGVAAKRTGKHSHPQNSKPK